MLQKPKAVCKVDAVFIIHICIIKIIIKKYKKNRETLFTLVIAETPFYFANFFQRVSKLN